jgi:hypothetical protein
VLIENVVLSFSSIDNRVEDVGNAEVIAVAFSDILNLSQHLNFIVEGL